jgi:cobalt-zinc-cadmium efflux system outer membrane protein
VDIAQADLQVARARYNDTRRDLSGRVRLAFHAVLAQQARIEIARARLEVTEKTAVAVSRQVRAGKAPPLEETRAQVVHQTLASEVRRAQSQLWMAGRELRALWGDDELGAFEGALRTEMPVLQQDSLAAELLSTHPLLHEYWWSAENHRHTERLLARQRWPQITPELGVRWLRSDHTRDFAAGVSVRLPLFDRKGGDLRGAKHQRQAALEDAQQVRLELLAALDVALRTLEEEHQRLSAYRTEIVPRAQESLRMARAGYEQGKFGYIDLLDAQRALIEIQREQTGALIAFDQALVRIEVLLGRDIE